MKNTKEPIIIGVVHLPLYGRNDPSKSIAEIEDYVLTNLHVFYDNGIQSLFIQDENPNDGSAEPETVALLASLGRLARTEMPQIDLGFINQSNDGIASIAAAQAAGANFVRIKVFSGAMLKAEGVMQGCGVESVKYRTQIGSKVKIFADAHDREGFPLKDIPIEAIAGWVSRAGADGIILTGKSYEETLDYLRRVDKLNLHKPLIVGGSVTEENIHEVLSLADGAIVSSSLMLDKDIPGSQLHWDKEKVRRFVEKVAAFKG